MHISQKQQIEDAIIENLLFAHKRIAGPGSVLDLLRLSRYLFRLADKRKDVLINLILEGDHS